MVRLVWHHTKTASAPPAIIVHIMQFAGLTGKHPAMNSTGGKTGKQRKSGRKYAESSSKLDQGAEPGH